MGIMGNQTLFEHIVDSQNEQALEDLNEAVKVAPNDRDVQKILMKAIEETANIQRRLPDTCDNVTSMVMSSNIIQDCCSSGVGSSLASTSERG